MLKNSVASLLIVSYGFAFAFNYSSDALSDEAFYFTRALLSIIICYIGFGFIDTKKGILGNWRLVLLCSLSLIDALLFSAFLISFFFNGLYYPILYLYWDADLSWRVIYSSIELLLILELAYNGIIYLYSFIHSGGGYMRKLTIENHKKAS